MKQRVLGCNKGILWLLSLGLFALAQDALAGDRSADPRAGLPARKAGLWEVTVQAHTTPDGRLQQPLTVRQCTDEKSERAMLLAILPAQENCNEVRVQQPTGEPGGGYDIGVVCSVHEQRIETAVELRGDLQSVYSGKYVAERAGVPRIGSGAVSFQGRWLGNCMPGQRPGDMVLPNGITVNVVDDVGRAEKHAH